MENDSEKDDMRNSLIDSIQDVQTVKHNCCYYLFCCQLLCSDQKVNEIIILALFQKILHRKLEKIPSIYLFNN